MKAPRNIMIMASAGSGKTYALTGRFIALLAQGVKPERIAALTFTRKAAGEFFDEILKKLAKAAGEPAAAAQLAAETGRPELRAEDFRRMLREVTDAMPRLRLGTLDGFMARVARTFALELGLSGDFEVLEDYGMQRARRRVLQRMLAATGELDDRQRDLLEAFKRATFGKEAKKLSALLEDFIEKLQQIYLNVPEAGKWGRQEMIWPDGCAWLTAAAEPEPAAMVRSIRTELAGLTLTDKQQEIWDKFFEQWQAWKPGGTFGDDLEKMLEKILAEWTALEAGVAILTLDRRKLTLGPGLCALLATATRHVVGGELRRRMEVTRGLHAVLTAYEHYYHPMVRRAGLLTFADVQRLLSPEMGAPLLTRGEAGEGRLAIDYRLDAEIDHWLLDEFQDTSRGQWNVLKNLIDEAVQDEAGGRSFFCVGDVKQAIYGWRAGEPRLFREILEHYNAAAETVGLQHLTESWRSGPAVIGMVNAVFGHAAVWARLFPGEISTRWNREWQEHSTRLTKRNGQAAWLQAADEDDGWAQTLALLREIRPWERGLSCAVLVRSNAKAAALADYLRSHGPVPAVAEADLHVCADNPGGAALLALVQAAAHPEDTLAQEHWQMTPLRVLLAAEGVTTAEQLTRRLLGQIHAEGFAGAMEYWETKLVQAGAVSDDFGWLRLRQFLSAAREFDETGSREVAEFVAFMQRHALRDSEGAGIVRVMTIHKSKGLGFDVVVLPDLEGNRLDQARLDPVAVMKTPDGRTEWVLEMPVGMLVEADARLQECKARSAAENGYEAIDLLYVAMTRAKRALYVVTVPVGKKSQSANYPRVLTETLGGVAREVRVGALNLNGGWAEGDADWHTKLDAVAVADGENTIRFPGLIAASERRPKRLEVRRPSGEREDRYEAANLFLQEEREAGEFGVAVHALLAEVEWADAAPPRSWDRHEVLPAARNEAIACLQAAELSPIWRRPVGGTSVELWRERGFEVVIDGVWVSGVFDRVMIERDTAGKVKQVMVYDFKTDGLTESQLVQAVARHERQMSLYRQAAAVLTGGNAVSVRSALVFTRLRCLVPAPVRLA